MTLHTDPAYNGYHIQTPSAFNPSLLNGNGTVGNKARKKRIILTCNYSPWSLYSGGGQRSTHYLATYMAQKGHDVHVIYSKSPFESVLLPDHLNYHVHWATLYRHRSNRKSFFRPLTAFSVNRLVKKLSENSKYPVIVHANGEEASLLYRIRNSLDFGFIATPRYSFYPKELSQWNRLTLMQKIKFFLLNWKYIELGRVLREADRICPPSQWASGEISRVYRIDPQKIIPVPNGIPQEFLQYQNDPNSDGDIVFFGRLSHDKGVDLLLRAYKKLDSPKPFLTIIGEGEEKEKLAGLSMDLGITHNVRFLPWLSHHELGQLLSKSRICVLPSRDENYSLAILSALCVSVPTISTRVGGTPEIIKDGETGLLVQYNDIESLTEAMRNFLANPFKAEEMGRNGSVDVRNSKTWASTCEKFDAIYDEVLELSVNSSHVFSAKR
ncbi:MAG: glycosyltransferase family 4 protein [Balneolaceae bacterium]